MDLVWSIDFQFYSPLLVTDDPNAVLCDDSAFFFVWQKPDFQSFISEMSLYKRMKFAKVLKVQDMTQMVPKQLTHISKCYPQ